MRSPELQAACDEAADLIEQYGWIQGSFGDHQHGFCLLRAIEPGSVDALYRELPMGLIVWNDEPGRTKEQVLAFLRRGEVAE